MPLQPSIQVQLVEPFLDPHPLATPLRNPAPSRRCQQGSTPARRRSHLHDHNPLQPLIHTHHNPDHSTVHAANAAAFQLLDKVHRMEELDGPAYYHEHLKDHPDWYYVIPDSRPIGVAAADEDPRDDEDEEEEDGEEGDE